MGRQQIGAEGSLSLKFGKFDLEAACRATIDESTTTDAK